MDDTELRCLEVDFNGVVASKILGRFIENNAQTFTFDELNRSGKRQRLFNILFKYLQKPDMEECHLECLESLRILSRQKLGLNENLDQAKIGILVKLSCLYSVEEISEKPQDFGNTEIIIAALKCLCNLVYNSNVAATFVSESCAMEGILTRLRMYSEPDFPNKIKQFDMKLMFLITALCPEIRGKLKEELHGLDYLIAILNLILKESPPSAEDEHKIQLKDADADLCSEVLKVIFNLMTRRMSLDGSEELEDQEEVLCLRLTSILHDLLLSEISESRKNEVRNHVVNLLTTIPFKCYSEMTIPAREGLPSEVEYGGRNMEAIAVLLDFLDEKLTAENPEGTQVLMSPILTVLLNLVKSQRLVRKYLRYRILPPLRDVWVRPEEGDTFRAKFCRMLTSASMTIKDLTAEFLFSLCKENVARMIKYTGYGNAAGMLATRGLMMGQTGAACYSSDSDSDTDEYIRHVEQINPVIGILEPPHVDPLAGMSDEQKEYEALKLVHMLDKLSRVGVVQPCRVNEEGRPEPVEHILQLQEELPRQQVPKPSK